MGRKAFEAAVVDLSQSIGMLVRRARAVAATDELSWTETAVLRRLAVEGAATTAELARVQEMKPQSMRTVVASLEEMGMVERSPHATDGRQVNLELTAKGMAAQKRASEVKQTWLAQAIARLDARERETLFEAGRILKKLVVNDRG